VTDPEPAGDSFEHWFDPKKLFADGYPKRVSSALRVFPQIAFDIQRIIIGINPKRALEVGPGDRPVITGIRGAVYLDLVPRFLKKVEGKRVVGDARDAPFKPGSFDLVVASDLFTHIPPKERTLALAELMTLAPKILIFNPESGTPEVKMSPVSSDELVQILEDEGLEVERRDFVAHAPKGLYRMVLLYGEKRPAGAL
jgi:hypothetical protein